MLDKIKKIVVDKATNIAEAAKTGRFYRRWAITKSGDKLGKNNENINRALLDLQDLAKNGEKKSSRRQFLSDALSRAVDRNKPPILNNISHTPMEQLTDVLDIKPKLPKKPVDTDFAYMSKISRF